MVERRPPVGGHPPDRPAQRRFLDPVAITSTSTRQRAPPLLGFLFLAIALIQQRPGETLRKWYHAARDRYALWLVLQVATTRGRHAAGSGLLQRSPRHR